MRVEEAAEKDGHYATMPHFLTYRTRLAGAVFEGISKFEKRNIWGDLLLPLRLSTQLRTLITNKCCPEKNKKIVCGDKVKAENTPFSD